MESRELAKNDKFLSKSHRPCTTHQINWLQPGIKFGRLSGQILYSSAAGALSRERLLLIILPVLPKIRCSGSSPEVFYSVSSSSIGQKRPPMVGQKQTWVASDPLKYTNKGFCIYVRTELKARFHEGGKLTFVVHSPHSLMPNSFLQVQMRQLCSPLSIRPASNSAMITDRDISQLETAHVPQLLVSEPTYVKGGAVKSFNLNVIVMELNVETQRTVNYVLYIYNEYLRPRSVLISWN